MTEERIRQIIREEINATIAVKLSRSEWMALHDAAGYAVGAAHRDKRRSHETIDEWAKATDELLRQVPNLGDDT